MRILIVGGGPAGLTLAAKLRQQGRDPVIVERMPTYEPAGFAISLLPLGVWPLHGLGLYDTIAEASDVFSTYQIVSHTGEILQDFDMRMFEDRYGPSLLLTHADIVNALRNACDDVEFRMGATIAGVDQSEHEVEVTLSDGSQETVDLLVGCDGIHSGVRTLAFGEQPAFETGWACWSWWGAPDLCPRGTVREYWLPGSLITFNATPTGIDVIAGLPLEHAPGDGADDAEIVATLRRSLGEVVDRVEEVEAALTQAEEPGREQLFLWPMHDVRSDDWYKGRVALCGDAGTAFLPTAGAGTSNAMRSATSLADTLSMADAQTVPLALEFYVKRTQHIVRKNQSDSREISKALFFDHGTKLTDARDAVLRHLSIDRMASNIRGSLDVAF